MSTIEPAGVEFDLASDEVIEIHVERGIDLPETLRLELRRRPRHGLKIHWDEQVWGKRGGAEGGAGGG